MIVLWFSHEEFDSTVADPPHLLYEHFQNAVKFEDKKILFADLKNDVNIIIAALPPDIPHVQDVKWQMDKVADIGTTMVEYVRKSLSG